MSTIFYRTRLNKEMKRFGKFSKDIVRSLNQNGHNIQMVFDPQRGNCVSAIQGHDTIIFIAHGNDDVIYHRYSKRQGKIQPLISHLLIRQQHQPTLSLLYNKKVIAISCRTARILGDSACTHAGCRVFLGFYNQIHLDKLRVARSESSEYYHFLLRCYKQTFKKVLEMAILNKWTFEKLAAVLKIELEKNAMAEAKKYIEVRSEYYRGIILSHAILAITNVAANIRVFGDSQELVG